MLHFYTSWKTVKFSDLFRIYKNVVFGRNTLSGKNQMQQNTEIVSNPYSPASLLSICQNKHEQENCVKPVDTTTSFQRL